jgi:hypothetical protein
MTDKQEQVETVTMLCEECGSLVELHDLRRVLLAQHLVYNCPSTEKLREP